MFLTDKSSYKENVKEIIMFRYLNDEELNKIIEISDFIKYDADEMVINEGDIKPYLYAVVTGTVNVMVREPDGQVVFISAIGEGEIFGEAGIFMNVKRSANIVTTDESIILRICRKDFIRFVRKFTSTGMKMLMLIIYSLIAKLRQANQELAFERKADIDQNDIDSIVANFISGDLEE